MTSKASTKLAPRYNDLDKATVRTLNDSGIGIKEISNRTGIARNTIRTWIRSDDDPNVEFLSHVLTAGLLKELRGLATVCITELTGRLQDRTLTSTRDVMEATKLTLDTMITLTSNTKPASEEKPTSETEFWRGLVSRMIMKAKQKGEEVTHEQAVQKIIQAKPEAAPFLLGIMPKLVEGEILSE